MNHTKHYNTMKNFETKYIFLFVGLLITTMGFAQTQTQQGYVKTRGRLDSNGNLIPGQGLKGAVVYIKGRNSVSVESDDGAFSFPVPKTQFRVDSVRKKDYQLIDVDALFKTYIHSSNPIYFVMETPEQQLQDQLIAERKIRRSLTNQLHQREDEIEVLKEQQKITDEEYRQALQKLYEETEQNEQLVKDMVDRYSKIDYDQLSEFDQRISELILNGELTKADSLLRTKGDINERVSQYHKHEAVNTKEKKELSYRLEQLQQSEILAIQERDDLANDCYRKFEIFKMQHLNDSAAHYIELRACLDTTNVEWQNDAGQYSDNFMANYSKALFYYQLALRQALEQYGEQSEEVATIYNNIACVYDFQGDFNRGLEYHNKALTIRKIIFKEGHPSLAISYTNIGLSYYEQGDYDSALEYHIKALANKSACSEDPMIIACCYNNIGMVYSSQGNHNKALDCFVNAISILKSVFGEEHSNVATCYNNIGYVYHDQGNYDKALEYYEKALIIRKDILGENHPDVAANYSNIGNVYIDQGNYEKAFEYDQKALSIVKTLFGENHPTVAEAYSRIGDHYYSQGDYNKALIYINKSLTIRSVIFGENHPNVAWSYSDIGWCYYSLGNSGKAIECFEKALNIWLSTLGESHPTVATSYINLGFVYYMQSDYDKALEYYEQALAIRKSVLGKDHPDTIQAIETIAEIHAKMKE